MDVLPATRDPGQLVQPDALVADAVGGMGLLNRCFPSSQR